MHRSAKRWSVDHSQKCYGYSQTKPYKGNVTTVGRRSDLSLYDENIASMEGVDSDYNRMTRRLFI